METLSPSSSVSARQESATTDELSMPQNLLFANSLKDLKNIRLQLYSAANYFELSYSNDEQKQIVMNTLKDYAVKALVNTIDHLGSMSYKVNGLIDEKVDEVSSSELRVSCIEQRIQTCKAYMTHEGRAQQSLILAVPRFHKQYLVPDEPMPESGRKATFVNQAPSFPCKEFLESNQIHNGILPSLSDKPPSLRKMHSLSSTTGIRVHSSSPQKGRLSSPSPSHGKFLTGKKAVSPLPAVNSLTRSGSLSIRPTLVNPSVGVHRHPVEAQKSFPVRLHTEKNDNKEMERAPSKSKGFLKALLSRRRSRKDDMLYNYIDEY